MKLDAELKLMRDGGDAASVARHAASLEELGFDGAWTPEAEHDAFLPLWASATSTTRLQLGTGIAVALSRNPMTVAYAANDLQLLSSGRFILGLGSQVQAHIERRFSSPWSKPASRMREMVLAIREIWDCWRTGEPLRFEGEFWHHVLMTPFFSPGPNRHGTPPIFLAGVSEAMTVAAGKVCEGFCAHSFTSPTYLREVTWPALRRGRAGADVRLGEPQVYLPLLLATGETEEQLAAAKAAVRQTLGFYASTAAYRGVLDAHGWGDVQTAANSLVREQRWHDLAAVIDDTVLGEFAVVAEPSAVGPAIAARYGALVQRISYYTPYTVAPDTWRTINDGVRGALASGGKAAT